MDMVCSGGPNQFCEHAGNHPVESECISDGHHCNDFYYYHSRSLSDIGKTRLSVILPLRSKMTIIDPDLITYN